MPNNTLTAFRWEIGLMVNLGTLGGNRRHAFGINNRGEIVGASRFMIGNLTYHGFLWRNGVMQDLGTLGGNESLAYNVSDNGWVTGESQTFTGIPRLPLARRNHDRPRNRRRPA